MRQWHLSAPLRAAKACRRAPLPAGLRLVALANEYRNEYSQAGNGREGDNEVVIAGEVLLGRVGGARVGACRFRARGRNVVNVRSVGGVRCVQRDGTTMTLGEEVVLRDFDEYHAWFRGIEANGEEMAEQLNTRLGVELFDGAAAMRLLTWLAKFFAPEPTVYAGYGS